MATIELVRRVDTSKPMLLRSAPIAIPAGFPSPAQDYYEGPIDLNAQLIDDPDATFIARVSGDSMIGVGIFDGDEVLVSRARKPRDGDIVVAVIDGELTLKRLLVTPRGIHLHSENPAYPDILVPELSDFTIWGTATVGFRHLL
ncbi:Error-prone repair protein UmuD [Microbacterium esteraromaticum]|uniref:Error-prone repair protein UmuD n=1 Tax=Microbacterium esteraromaticum TaxID=57043 RepID=A0A1R4KIT2_9MICO|nr:translesion error-prone DNA polymerase V autoproteolytic subunit [Microbacterium esteraromaticum]SJN44107.1 Error-prone repair protein UmuD [Microbacterium esteraromaticum]